MAICEWQLWNTNIMFACSNWLNRNRLFEIVYGFCAVDKQFTIYFSQFNNNRINTDRSNTRTAHNNQILETICNSLSSGFARVITHHFLHIMQYWIATANIIFAHVNIVVSWKHLSNWILSKFNFPVENANIKL